MIRTLKKIGNSKGFIMTRDMMEQLGLTNDTVDVSIERDRIIITAPRTHGRQSFEEAKEATFEQYDDTMQRLANAG